MTPKYPLTEALGVEMQKWIGPAGALSVVVLASDLERILSAAPEVWICRGQLPAIRSIHFAEPVGAVEKAKVLCVQPIVRDTAESLLRELIEEWDTGRVYAPSDKRNLYERAKQLLGGKGEGL